MTVRHLMTQGLWRWGALTAVVPVVLFASLAVGDLPLGPTEVWDALTGSATPFTTAVVVDWRLPRVLAALAFGAALGAAGAIFQSLTRNPLGSPDVIGFDTGAYTGVLLALLTVPAAGFATLATASLLGGLATAALVTVLTARSGLTGRRFIVTGIAVSALLTSVNTWLVYKTDPATAATGSIWAAGTLDNLRWKQATPALLTLAALAALTYPVATRLRILALGDDVATGLGLPVTRSRALLIACAVGLTAVTTAIAGPIAFIALAAPHLARPLLPRGHPITAGALVGAVLLGVADWAAAHLFAPTQLPVGALTVTLGGGYLALTLVLRR
ncbi:iron chelate uptake ABC transporter family permease subunit [Actinosynnema sp. NPDC020468]|uniref:FecCD family ABC transporter permease n=1 Tax=Actinosynnema sp. NPDC020468 TaxID=3154488 RepID=UPI0033E5A5BB